MLVGHLPAGILLGHRILRRFRDLNPKQRVCLWIGVLFGSVAPDLDVFYHYLLDEQRTHHHRYWPHLPFFWLVGSPLLLWHRVGRVFLLSVFVHLVLDTWVGGIAWGWPWNHSLLRCFVVPRSFDGWIWSFVFHWTFLPEVGLLAFSLHRILPPAIVEKIGMAKGVAAIRVVAAWVWSFLFLTFCLLVQASTFRRLPAGAVMWMHRTWGRGILWIAGVELKCVGRSTLEVKKSCVVIINHQSTLDLGWAAAIAPPGALAIGKKELLYIPVVNWAWWAFGHVRIDRSNTEKALRAMRRVAAVVKDEHRSLFIAPEGTRSPQGDILPFKKGAFRLAIEAEVPICPVVVCGANRLLPKGRVLPKPGTVTLCYLPPVETTSWRVEELEERMAEVRASMMGALTQLEEAYPQLPEMDASACRLECAADA